MTEFYSLSVIKELIKVHSTKKLAYLMAFRQGNEEYWDFKIEQMLKAYPEINPDWFLTGEGNMLKSDVHTTGIKESKSPTA